MRARRPFAALAATAITALGPACGHKNDAPPQVSAFAGTDQTAGQGTAVAVPPAVRVVNGSGNPAAGVAVTFRVGGGGGSITAPGSSAPRTSLSVATVSDGSASVGSWVMGPAGPQTLVAEVPGAAGSPVTFSATSLAVLPSDATSMEAASLTLQHAQAGHAVGDPPAVLVLDAQGLPVPNVAVTFQVTAGGGSLTGAAAGSDANGVARVGSWTLGTAGVQQVQASVPGLAGSPVAFEAALRTTGFDITLQFVSPVTVAQNLAFQRARERIEQVIVGDLRDVRVTQTAVEMATCGGGPALDQVVDDLLIRVNLVPIDGPGKVLGQSGPCLVRTPGNLPLLGVMKFDTADLATLEARGQLDEVVLHEMLHVVGFGFWELWPTLATGTGGPDPYFTGTQAVDAFLNFNGGSLYSGHPVPLENTGAVNDGTRDVHWRETVLKNELMTGWLTGATQPLSRTTVGCLNDLGYQVDLLAADPFDLATAGLRLAPAGAEPAPLEMGDDLLRTPLRTVDEEGTIRPR